MFDEELRKLFSCSGIIRTLRITGLSNLFIVQNSKSRENTTFRKLDLFSSSDQGRETPTLLGPLEKATLNQWTTHVT
jgi:hypothetical protein